MDDANDAADLEQVVIIEQRLKKNMAMLVVVDPRPSRSAIFLGGQRLFRVNQLAGRSKAACDSPPAVVDSAIARIVAGSGDDQRADTRHDDVMAI